MEVQFMPAPYSLDLRQKVLHAVERKLGSQREIAELFGVSQSFVERLLMRQRATGDCAPKPPPSALSTRKLDEASRQQIRQWVEQQPDLTLAEIAERLHMQLRIDASLPTICRALQQLHLPRKKKPCTQPSGIPNGCKNPAATTGSR
jgi:transposase